MNSEIPKFPVVGSEVSASQMRGVVNAIRRFMPIAGNGILISRTCGGTVISAAPKTTSAVAAKPWTFYCSVQKDKNGQETGRTGGWTNCRAQIGLDIDWCSKDVLWHGADVDESTIEEGTHWISGTETTADGNHALKVTLGSGANGSDTAKIVVMGPNDESDPVAGILFIRIGTVTNGKLFEPAPHINPVIYKYL